MDWPSVDVESLVPHRGMMLLIDRVIEVEEEHLVAETTIRADDLFDQNGKVPAFVGMEYMAQAIAAFAGAQALRSSKPVKLGFLLGTRRYNSNISEFRVGAPITILVQSLIQEANDLRVFDCEIQGDGIEINARLTVFQPDNLNAYLNG